MASLIVAIISLMFLILVLVLVFRKWYSDERSSIISSKEREMVLANLSVLMAAAMVGVGVAALIEVGSLPTSSFSIQLIVVVLEFIALFTLGGALLSFFIFRALKWVFNVK